MKWQGRRQSSNIIDARGVVTLNLSYIPVDGMSVSSLSSDLVVEPDGEAMLMTSMELGTSVSIAFRQSYGINEQIRELFGYSVYNLTPGQKNTLQNICRSIAATANRSVVVNSDAEDLAEFARAAIRNFRG